MNKKILLIGSSFLLLLSIILYFVFKEDNITTTINPKKNITTLPPIDFSKSDTLQQNQELLSNSGLISKNKKFTFVLQNDGNLVLYDAKRAVWSTNTSGSKLRLKFETTGSLNLYDGTTVKWYLDPVNSVSGGTLKLQDDGNLVMADSSGKIRWTSWYGIVYNFEKGDTLKQPPQSSGILWYREGLKSQNGLFTFVAQQDGNFVIYNQDKKPTWSTNTFVNNSIRTGNATQFYFTEPNSSLDAELKVHDYTGKKLWGITIPELGSNSRLVMQNDGNLVVYDSHNTPRWSSWYGHNPTLKNWVCLKDGVKKGDVTVNWGPEIGGGIWACNQWLSECEGKCTVEKSNWECKKGDQSMGIAEIGKGVTALNTKFDAQWACNTWNQGCNTSKDCQAFAVDPSEYRKANSAVTTPNTCLDNKELSGALCYPKCNAGFTGVANLCLKNCPTDFRDDGYYCAKPAPYGRGAGYPWMVGDWVGNYDQAKKRCEKENPQGCDLDGLIYYPKCKKGYHAFGCCTCTPDCEPGSIDIGVSCKKESYDRGAGNPMDCPVNKSKIGGLCYNNQ